MTFKYPSRTNEFKQELYPPTPSNVPVWENYTDWSSNATKPPNLYTYEEGKVFDIESDEATTWTGVAVAGAANNAVFTGASAHSDAKKPAPIVRAEHPDKIRIRVLEKQVADL